MSSPTLDSQDDYVKYPPTRWTRSHGPPLPHSYNLRRSSRNQGTPYKSIASQTLLAQHVHSQINTIFDASGKKMSLSRLLIGPTRKIWDKALSN